MKFSIQKPFPFSMSGAKISVSGKLEVINGQIEISAIMAGNIKCNVGLGEVFPSLYEFSKFCRLDDENIAFDAKVMAYDSSGHARFVLSTNGLKRVHTYEMESNFSL